MLGLCAGMVRIRQQRRRHQVKLTFQDTHILNGSVACLMARAAMLADPYYIAPTNGNKSCPKQNCCTATQNTLPLSSANT